MLTYFDEFIALGLIAFLGAVSPGPDFVLISKIALSQNRKAGVIAALGVSVGCLVHISYCLIGIGFLVAQSILLFSIIKYLGAAYLIYIGFQALRAKKEQGVLSGLSHSHAQTQPKVNYVSAFHQGFMVNLLNPKGALFFLSVFTQVIDPHTPTFVQLLMGLEMSLIGFLWFSFLTFVLSSSSLKKRLLTVGHLIEKCLGGALIFLGLKVATLQN